MHGHVNVKYMPSLLDAELSAKVTAHFRLYIHRVNVSCEA